MVIIGVFVLQKDILINIAKGNVIVNGISGIKSLQPYKGTRMQRKTDLTEIM